MPPKAPAKGKAAPPDPPAISEDVIEAELQALREREEVPAMCESIVTKVIWPDACDIIDDRYYNSLLGPYVLERCITEMLDVVQLAFVSHDPGDDLEDEDLWASEAEPLPLGGDSWSRGVIPVRANIVRKTPEEVPSTPQVGTGGAGGPRRPASRVGGRSHPGGDSQPSAAGESTIKELAPLARTKQSVGKKKAGTARRHDEDAVIRELERRELEQLQKLQKDLRGKDYTYDQNGNVIVIQKLNTAKLPAASVQTKVKLAGDADDEEGAEGGAPSRPSAASATTATSTLATTAAMTLAAGAAGDKRKPHITSTHSAAPMVQGMTLAAGVTLRSTDAASFKAKKGAAGASSGGAGGASSSFNATAPTRPQRQPPPALNTTDGALGRVPKLPNKTPRSSVLSPAVRDAAAAATAAHAAASAANSAGSPPDASPVRAAIELPPDHQPPQKKVQKVSHEERQTILGARRHYPRDRRFTNASGQRNLPPPIYPATRGHGFVTKSYLAQDNPYTTLHTGDGTGTGGENSVYSSRLSQVQSHSGMSTVSGSSLSQQPSTYKHSFPDRIHPGVVRTINSKLIEDLQVVDIDDATNRVDDEEYMGGGT